MHGVTTFSLPFILLHAFFFFLSALSNHHPPNPLKLELVHRHSFQLTQTDPITRLQCMTELIHSDMARHRLICLRQGQQRRSSGGAAAELPLRSANDYGVAAYHVRFKVGTPGQSFLLAADTGSDLTWMKCRYRCHRRRCRINHNGSIRKRVFDAVGSSSFRPIPCASKMCRVELFNYGAMASFCPSPLASCSYNYTYFDTSFALGIFSKETVTARQTTGKLTKLHNVLIGCTESPSGFQAVDGILGLGFSKFSFTRQAAKVFGGKFSYCLVDHLSHKKVTSYLTFGESETQESTDLKFMHRTKLLTGVVSPYYMVNIIGISVGNIMLNIPSEVWDVNRGGGTIIDSGTSLTTLAPKAYRLVMIALELSLIGFKRVKVEAPLEYCFASAGFQESLMPKLKFHFADGAEFEPHVKSYIIDVDVGVKCIGFTSGVWPGISIIGNIMQQNYYWEFDLTKKILGFAPSSCT